MTTFHIRCFVETVRELNFSRAAQKLYISQPALSRYISGMEKELEVTLFDRSANRHITLTEAGAAYFDLYSRFLEDSDLLKKKFDRQKHDPFSRFRFGYFAGWDISFFLPQLLDLFEAGHPGVDVQFVGLPHKDLFAGLERGDLEVVLVPQEYLPENSHVRWETVTDIPYLIQYSDGFLEHCPKACSVTDLRDATFYMTADSLTARRQELSATFARNFGFSPHVVTLPNTETVMTYVKSGLGVTLTDSWGRNAHGAGFYTRLLNEPRRVVLCWPASVTHRFPQRIVKELQQVLGPAGSAIAGGL